MSRGARRDLLRERATGIGGSDAHHLRSEEPWGCRRRLWYEKRGVPADFPLELELAGVPRLSRLLAHGGTDVREANERAALLRRGRALEALACREYATATMRRVVHAPEAIRREGHPYLLVHVDRKIMPPPGPKYGETGPGYLEAKVLGARSFHKVLREGLPVAYLLQVQWGLMVTGWTWGAFVLFWPDGWRLLHWTVERDPVLCDALEQEGFRFQRELEHGPEPSKLPIGDARCGRCPWRRSCVGLETALSTDQADLGDLEHDESLAEILADYVDARAAAVQAESTLEAVKSALKDRLGTRTAVEAAGMRAYYRVEPRSVFDQKGLRAAHPKIAAAFTSTSSPRVLRVYGGGDG